MNILEFQSLLNKMKEKPATSLLQASRQGYVDNNIKVTLDTLCYYGIDLTKRININGITNAPMNILSIDIKLSDFKVSLNLDNSQPYQRTVSMSYRGE